MHGFLRQGTAATVVIGPELDSTDGNTQETALSIAQADVRLSKNAAAFAQANDSNAAVHMEAGYYSKALNATDIDTLGRLIVAVHKSGALAARGNYLVITAEAYDAMFATTGPLPQYGIIDRGTLQSAASTTSRLRAAAAFGDNTLTNCILMAYGSTQGYWQQVQITSNVGSTDDVTHPAWPVTPTGTVTYLLLGVPGANTSLPVPANTVQVGGTTQTAGDLAALIATRLADSAYTAPPSASAVAAAVLVAELAALDGLVNGATTITIGGVTYTVTRVARDAVATMAVEA